jgi:dGTPase
MARAIYAQNPAESRGRLFPEEPSPGRSDFQRDRDRIIHSTAFRRLKDKTQVFLFDEGDHYRTRLTHTIEVAQIARALARALDLDEDLAEALALAHDLGHPPFGHAGERALGEAMAAHGGFDHNAQSLRVVTLLERRYPRYDGLNLTWETLEGLVKHNGPLRPPLPFAVAEYARLQNLELSTWPGAEAQAAAVADDIAYDAHDADDGLRAGLLTLEGLADVRLFGEILAGIGREYPDLSRDRVHAALVRRTITAMIEDVVAESRRRLQDLAPKSAAEVRATKAAVIGFSRAMEARDREIKSYLGLHLYRHPDVMAVMGGAARVVGELFAHYRAHPDDLADGWRPAVGADSARTIADFLAGMTDRYALAAHRRLCGGSGELR